MQAAKTDLGYFLKVSISSFIILPLLNSISIKLLLSLLFLIKISFSTLLSLSLSLNIFNIFEELFSLILFFSFFGTFRYNCFNSSFLDLFCFK